MATAAVAAEKRLLLSGLRDSIAALVETQCAQAAHLAEAEAGGIPRALEGILWHGSVSASEASPCPPWSFLTKVAARLPSRSTAVSCAADTDHRRLKTWIRACLNDRCLQRCLAVIFSAEAQSIKAVYYHEWSLLFDVEAASKLVALCEALRGFSFAFLLCENDSHSIASSITDTAPTPSLLEARLRSVSLPVSLTSKPTHASTLVHVRASNFYADLFKETYFLINEASPSDDGAPPDFTAISEVFFPIRDRLAASELPLFGSALEATAHTPAFSPIGTLDGAIATPTLVRNACEIFTSLVDRNRGECSRRCLVAAEDTSGLRLSSIARAQDLVRRWELFGVTQSPLADVLSLLLFFCVLLPESPLHPKCLDELIAIDSESFSSHTVLPARLADAPSPAPSCTAPHSLRMLRRICGTLPPENSTLLLHLLPLLASAAAVFYPEPVSAFSDIAEVVWPALARPLGVLVPPPAAADARGRMPSESGDSADVISVAEIKAPANSCAPSFSVATSVSELLMAVPVQMSPEHGRALARVVACMLQHHVYLLQDVAHQHSRRVDRVRATMRRACGTFHALHAPFRGPPAAGAQASSHLSRLWDATAAAVAGAAPPALAEHLKVRVPALTALLNPPHVRDAGVAPASETTEVTREGIPSAHFGAPDVAWRALGFSSVDPCVDLSSGSSGDLGLRALLHLAEECPRVWATMLGRIHGFCIGPSVVAPTVGWWPLVAAAALVTRRIASVCGFLGVPAPHDLWFPRDDAFIAALSPSQSLLAPVPSGTPSYATHAAEARLYSPLLTAVQAPRVWKLILAEHDQLPPVAAGVARPAPLSYTPSATVVALAALGVALLGAIVSHDIAAADAASPGLLVSVDRAVAEALRLVPLLQHLRRQRVTGPPGACDPEAWVFPVQEALSLWSLQTGIDTAPSALQARAAGDSSPDGMPIATMGSFEYDGFEVVALESTTPGTRTGQSLQPPTLPTQHAEKPGADAVADLWPTRLSDMGDLRVTPLPSEPLLSAPEPLLTGLAFQIERSVFGLARPRMADESDILSRDCLHSALLEAALPRPLRGYVWQRCFSLVRHGAALETLLAKVRDHDSTLIVIKDDGGAVFGGFAADRWAYPPRRGGGRYAAPYPSSSSSVGSGYFGSGQSFVFTFGDRRRFNYARDQRQQTADSASAPAPSPTPSSAALAASGPHACVRSPIAASGTSNPAGSRSRPSPPLFSQYRWARHGSAPNKYFQLVSGESIAMGGGGSFAWILDSDLCAGASGACATFDSPCLSSAERFTAIHVEAWAFLPRA